MIWGKLGFKKPEIFSTERLLKVHVNVREKPRKSKKNGIVLQIFLTVDCPQHFPHHPILLVFRRTHFEKH